MDISLETSPIKSLSRNQLVELMKHYGQPAFRARQVIQWLYQRGISSYNEMTNVPLSLRNSLQLNNPLFVPEIIDRQVSRDGTRKYLLQLHDRNLVETVGIPSRDGRLTVCFSTQVGCAMGCVFCATGKEGFTRNLTVGEIIDQIITVQNDFQSRVTNLVGMGQGEPFLNFDAVVGALDIINSKDGLEIGARKITLSSCGIIKGIQRFSHIKEQYTLAISLHSARQDIRDFLMPYLASNPLSKLKDALAAYIETTNRRVTFEYTLIDGVNDSSSDLEALLAFTDGLLCHVNLIKLNSVPGSPFQPTNMNVMERWKQEIERHGIESTIRVSKGSDIFGACGQLKNARK